MTVVEEGYDLINIIMKIPKETALLNITAVILDKDGCPCETYAQLSTDEIRNARQDFLDNVKDGDDYDAVWTLTDKGRELAEHIGADEDGIWDGVGINDIGGE